MFKIQSNSHSLSPSNNLIAEGSYVLRTTQSFRPAIAAFHKAASFYKNAIKLLNFYKKPNLSQQPLVSREFIPIKSSFKESLTHDVALYLIVDFLTIQDIKHLSETNKTDSAFLKEERVLAKFLSHRSLHKVKLIAHLRLCCHQNNTTKSPVFYQFKVLDFSSQPISKEDFLFLIAKCPNLNVINLAGCQQIDDECIEQLSQHCQHLDSINLANCTQITFKAISQITSRYPFLKAIDLSGYKNATNDNISILTQNCTQLESIHLRNCPVTNAFLTSLLENGSKLRHLALGQCCIQHDSIVTISQKCPALESIDLSNCQMIRDESVSILTQNCLSLKQINLSNCQTITDQAISSLIENCHNLEEIALMSNLQINSQAIVNLIKKFKSTLKLINLNDCNINDQTILEIATGCQNLESVHISLCNISIQTLFTLIEKNPKIRMLDISWNNKMTSQIIAAIIQKCLRLECIQLSFCNLSNQSFIDLTRDYPRVKLINGSFPAITIGPN